ncbi:uncharacterized protein E0L32_011536 [Thyridium curvatum]|uniref:F-box domain-containing protein n=1 Tax=Thyridium curvatum TaxID=1093900 RepID=A0A507BFU9_9PEZI|nr:uncharacterized protein E0L32_011536 [Thyridium curvatum]TPX18787.1 hypothetical protein E0L32_011536 [Thyridium curvatum]
MPRSAAARRHRDDDTDEEELVDLTADLSLHSKRSERQRRRQQSRAARAASRSGAILNLPYELLVLMLSMLHPGDVVRFSAVNRNMRDFVHRERDNIANAIIKRRYRILERCFRLPVLLADVDPELHGDLQLVAREDIMAIHKRPYQHVPLPDPTLICTCLTCLLRWNSLCLVLDFAHWQGDLDQGNALPIIPRGKSPEWNHTLLSSHAALVREALADRLLYAHILQIQLNNTVRSIHRHAQNKGNQRRRFKLSKGDEAAETDQFLEASGPPTLDFPFHRDNYYMLEAYMPGRSWNGDEQRWMYMPAEQHNVDLKVVVRFARWKESEEAKKVRDSEVFLQELRYTNPLLDARNQQ